MSAGRQLMGGLGRLAAAGLAAAGGARLSILIFHRVLPLPDPLLPGEVYAERFDRLMALVASSFRVLPLADAVLRLGAGSLPARALCITFDDGYADNHDIALPILLRHRLTASFFVATGFLDGGRMFNDTVVEAVRRSPLVGADLSAFGLGIVQLSTIKQRAELIARILPSIKYLTPAARVAALDNLCGALNSRGLPDDLMMSSRQVQALHSAGMTIGAHTVHHPILATLDDDEAEAEVTSGRAHLQDLIDAPVDLLAYPNGKPDRDYDWRHTELAKRLGFTAAVSTAAGCASRNDDPFQLPRFTPWDATDGAWLSRLVAYRRSRRFAVASQPTHHVA